VTAPEYIEAPEVKTVAASLLLWALASFAAGAGVPIAEVTENWDSYATGTGDANYNSRWATLPGAERYSVDQGPFGAATVWSPPHGLHIGKLRTYGIMRDLTPEITLALPEATIVVGTDEDVLRVRFYVDFNSLNQQEEDIFVELSRGDEHTDSNMGTLRSVVAFGMTHGWFGPSLHPRIFNGSEWTQADGVLTDKRSNHFTLEITTERLRLVGEQRASGSHEVLRSYLGGFNTVTIRTVQQNDQAHMLDNLHVFGGEVVEELGPPPLPESIEPEEGRPEGGTQVVITGGQFDPDAAVYFGGIAAEDTSVLSATELVCTTPPHEEGVVYVRVTNPDKQSGLLKDSFRYSADITIRFHRGDCNGDGVLAITDGIFLFNYLFLGGEAPSCLESANSNDDGNVDITDGIHILNYLFLGGEKPLPPGPPDMTCGIDPLENPPDSVSCESYLPCS
jgi:hypothetical protein